MSCSVASFVRQRATFRPGATLRLAATERGVNCVGPSLVVFGGLVRNDVALYGAPASALKRLDVNEYSGSAIIRLDKAKALVVVPGG